jgi:Fur family ferric uptake transcriptional regulator
MTQAPFSATLEFSDIDDAVALLRSSGCRVSAARRVLLEALFAANGPVSVEQLAAGIGGTTPSDLPSVYRNLERFEELGLVRHVHLGHGPGLYALRSEVEHEYLVCERCGKVRSIEPEQLDPLRAELEARFGHQARFSHFPIGGLCESCAGELSA